MMKNSPDSELRSILREERDRLRELAALYRSRISKLPKGYISVKKINGRHYAYLSYREKDRIRSVYIGKSPSEKAAEMKRLIESRKEYQSQLKLVRGRIRELEKIINKKGI